MKKRIVSTCVFVDETVLEQLNDGKTITGLLRKEESKINGKTLVGYVFEYQGQYDSAEKPKKEDKVPYVEIIGYLNEKTDSRYSAKAQATRKLIHARFAEGRTLDDFKAVIDLKVAEWKNDPVMCKYLRPETLFCTKFERYLMDAERNVPEAKEEPKSRFDVLDRDFYDALVSKGAITGDRLRIMRLTDEEADKLRSYGLL